MGDITRDRRHGSLAVAIAIAIAVWGLPSAVATAKEVECPDGGQITITRELGHGTIGEGQTADFTYTITGPDGSGFVGTAAMTVADGGSNSVVVDTPAGVVGGFTVDEDTSHPAVPPSDNVTVMIEGASNCNGQVVFVNHVDGKAKVRVIKTETSGWGTRRARGKWTFELTGPEGSVTKRTNRNGRRYRLVFRDLPAGSYTLCEWFTGWISNLGNGKGYYLPNGDRCVDFELDESEVARFRVNNRCPLSTR